VRTSDEVAAQLGRRFQLDYPDWARGGGHWPFLVNLQPPMTRERSEDPVGCHEWAGRWSSYDGPEPSSTRMPGSRQVCTACRSG
jgi:hypothetical protein